MSARRTCDELAAATPQAAEALAELAYGPACYCACMNLSRCRG